MSEIAKVLKEVAEKVGKALGRDASQAEHRLLHDTGDRLEANVKSHVEHDAEAAVALERAAKGDAENIRMPHGESGEPTLPQGGTGPSASKPPELHGGGREPLPGETDLPNPRDKLSNEQYPYLQGTTSDLEEEAVRGDIPATPAVVADRLATHPELPAEEIPKFQGPIEPTWMEPGQTYYRAAGDGTRPNSTYWTPVPPNGEPGLRRDLAVLNEWNGDHGLVTFTPNERIPVWSGEVAPQPASGIGKGTHYLPGGGQQIWIPFGSIDEKDGHWTIAPMPDEVRS